MNRSTLKLDNLLHFQVLIDFGLRYARLPAPSVGEQFEVRVHILLDIADVEGIVSLQIRNVEGIIRCGFVDLVTCKVRCFSLRASDDPYGGERAGFHSIRGPCHQQQSQDLPFAVCRHDMTAQS